MYKSKSQIKREYKKRQPSPHQHPPKVKELFPFHGTVASPHRGVGGAWSHSHSDSLPASLLGQEADGGIRNSRWRSDTALPPARRGDPQQHVPPACRQEEKSRTHHRPPRQPGSLVNGAHGLVFGFLVVGLGFWDRPSTALLCSLCLNANDLTQSEPTPVRSRTPCCTSQRPSNLPRGWDLDRRHLVVRGQPAHGP